MCLLVAGAFLLTPGLLTDAVGFLLFIPPFRRTLAKMAFRRLSKNMKIYTNAGDQPGEQRNSRPNGDGPIIDGEYEHVEPDHRSSQRTRPNNSSPWLPPTKEN